MEEWHENDQHEVKMIKNTSLTGPPIRNVMFPEWTFRPFFMSMSISAIHLVRRTKFSLLFMHIYCWPSFCHSANCSWISMINWKMRLRKERIEITFGFVSSEYRMKQIIHPPFLTPWAEIWRETAIELALRKFGKLEKMKLDLLLQ